MPGHLLRLCTNGVCALAWDLQVKQMPGNLSYLLALQTCININWLNLTVEQRLKDQCKHLLFDQRALFGYGHEPNMFFFDPLFNQEVLTENLKTSFARESWTKLAAFLNIQFQMPQDKTNAK